MALTEHNPLFKCIEVTAAIDSTALSARGDLKADFGLAVDDGCGGEAGVVAQWRFDGAALVVRSDRHGYIPLYYARKGDAFLVADSPLRLLEAGVSAELDNTALSFFAYFGFPPGDQSLFREIHRIPAGSELKFENGELSITCVEPRWTEEGPTTVQAAVDGWIDRFQVAMQRRMPSADFAMPLSGGRDSRMMLMALCKAGVSPREVLTLGSARDRVNEDATIALAIAKRFGLRHRFVTPGGGWFNNELNRHRMCGGESIEHAWLMELWHDLGTRYDCWYDGLGVGVMTRSGCNTQAMLDAVRSKQYESFFKHFCTLTATPEPEQVAEILAVFDPSMPSEHETLQTLVALLEPLLEAPNPMTRFSFTTHGRRGISLNAYGICRNTRCVHTPFMDRDLCDWTAAVPAEISFKDDLQTAACRKLYPETADIPFDSGAQAVRSQRSLRKRIGNRMDRERFFLLGNAPGAIFQKLATPMIRSKGSATSGSRALNLMMHLTLMRKPCFFDGRKW